MKRMLLVYFSVVSFAFANTPFTLTDIKELHVVIENTAKMIDKETEAKLLKMIKEKLHSLKIKTDTFSGESMVLMVGQNEFGDMKFLNNKLLVISQVKRPKSDESILGVIYMMDDLFDTTEPKPDMLDSLEFMLSEFSEQFIEDNSY